MDGFRDFVRRSHKKQLALSKIEGSLRYHRFLDTIFANRDIRPNLRVAPNHATALELLYKYPAYRENVRVIQFTAVRGGASAVYCTAYWWPGGIKYVTLSPAFVSKRGDYRRGVIPLTAFDQIRSAFRDSFGPADADLARDIAAGDLQLSARVFPTDANSPEILAEAAEHDLERAGYLFGAMAAVIETKSGRFASNTLDGYGRVVLAPIADKLAAISETNAGINFLMLRNLVLRADSVAPKTKAEVGVRTIPLKSWAATQPGDIRFPEWLELYVSRLLSDSVVGFAAAQFPVVGHWFYFDGSEKAVYENPDVARMFDRSDVARESLVKLREARYPARAAASTGLDSRIYKAARFARKSLVMSNEAVCILVEHCGLSFADVPRWISKDCALSYKEQEAFTDPALFGKILFEALFGLEYAHSKLGIAHGNLTLQSFSWRYVLEIFDYANNTTIATNPLAAFVVRDERSTYVFPYDGRTVCVLGFGRAVLGGSAARAHLVREFGEAYFLTFVVDQAAAAVAALVRDIGAYAEQHLPAIRALAFDQPDLFFELVRGGDMLAACRAFVELTEIRVPAGVRPFVVAPDVAKMAKKAEKVAHDWLINALEAVDHGDVVRVEDLDGEHRAFAALARLFDAWAYSAWDPYELEDSDLIEVHNSNVVVPFTISDPARWPPYLQLARLEQYFTPDAKLMFTDAEVAAFRDQTAANAAAAHAAVEPADPTTSEFFAAGI